MSKQPHVLVIPYPAQGHVAPLLKLATKIAEHGIKVTFVNTEFIEAKVMASIPEKAEGWSLIKFVSISDGIERDDDRKDFDKTRNTMLRVMPGNLKDLIEKINQSSDCEQITCVIADISVRWALEVAQNLGVSRAAFIPYGPENLALSFHVTKMIEDGILDSNGKRCNDNCYQLSNKASCFSTKIDCVELWHKKLGQLNFKDLVKLSRKEVVKGLPKLDFLKGKVEQNCLVKKVLRIRSNHGKEFENSHFDNFCDM
ncbi:UDP-glycosyltransferase 83A1-like [Pistacia vera]|uniref:UDP-glycosyltransferase 83A1-like n=1 Tax=Pistacia vera TaxID=55513 RepID=UPI001262DE97|nr:UDP-glycosyltransferase 83A1-like [Pistacia vera]